MVNGPERAGKHPEPKTKTYKNALGGYKCKEEEHAYHVAEGMSGSKSKNITKEVTRTLKRGEDIVTREEEEYIEEDGTAIIVTTITKYVAACGRKIFSENDFEGFCSECDKAVCREHAAYCRGYGSSACNKLLCPEHARKFIDEDGVEHACCLEHYNMNVWRQKKDPFGIKKEKQSANRKDENE
jgi:hypothetical protein